MRKIIQKGKIRVIQKQIIHYFCDRCGKRTGTISNPKVTWFGGISDKPTESHFCKNTCDRRTKSDWKQRDEQ